MCQLVPGRCRAYVPRPDPELDDILLGVLGRAQRLYPVEIYGFSFSSNHYHLLLRVPDTECMSDFMEHFQSNSSREVGRLRGWSGTLWSRRYESIVISDEAAAQVDRLRYVLAQGIKDGLVAQGRRVAWDQHGQGGAPRRAHPGHLV